MRENRTYGSEGGEAPTAFPTPIIPDFCMCGFVRNIEGTPDPFQPYFERALLFTRVILTWGFTRVYTAACQPKGAEHEQRNYAAVYGI